LFNLFQPLSNNLFPMEDSTKRHICIVGAGISGLRCADVLLSHGFQVTILEARQRIGGRVGSSTP
jgi:monoamine oxidase